MRNISLTLLALGSLSACVSIQATEGQQLAYAGKGPNPCLFGGVTREADWHCQEVQQGLAGVLRDVNRRVIDALEGRTDDSTCQLHVARVRALLWERPGLRVRNIFSCPKGRDNCHVSALVTDNAGREYVLDNGAVLKPAFHVASVGELRDFVTAVGGEYGFHPPIVSRQVAPAKPVVVARRSGLHWETRLRKLPDMRRR